MQGFRDLVDLLRHGFPIATREPHGHGARIFAIGKRDGVFRNTVAQCNYGLDHVKLTDLRGSIELPDAQAACMHVKRDMLVDSVW